jgi:hypothetical protein
MAFSAEISRNNPTCLLFLIDHSSSMDGPFGGQPGKKKSDGVADAINRLLQNLVLKCAKSTGVRDYFHVGVIGYGAAAKPVLVGTSLSRPLLPISAIANAPLRVETRKRAVDDGAGGLVEQSDTNPLNAATNLKALKSSDGNVLLFNAHLSSAPGAPITFPALEDNLPDVFSKLLFRMSSVLPPQMRQAAQEEGYDLNGPARGFVFNADLVAVTRFLEIGTRVASSVR